MQQHKNVAFLVNVCIHALVRAHNVQTLDVERYEVRHFNVSLCVLRLIETENLVAVLFSGNHFNFHCGHWKRVLGEDLDLDFALSELVEVGPSGGVSVRDRLAVGNEFEEQVALLARLEEHVATLSDNVPAGRSRALLLIEPELPLLIDVRHEVELRSRKD